MKVIVTGGCGFIGSEVVRQLVSKGYEVLVVDNLSKIDSRVKQGYEFRRVDLTDREATLTVFKGADICINLAAKIGGIGYFHKYPATILAENNKIYSNTFEAAVKHRLKRMVYISSSMVFESATQFPSKETDLPKIPPPVSSYGFSKLSGEWYCRSFWDEHKLPFSICRPFNAYGVNEYPGEEVGYAHVIPDLIKKILSGQYPLELLGDGQQTRCFTHVSDVAGGIIAVMEHPDGENEDFNVSNPEEIRILDLARKIWDICEMQQPFRTTSVPGFTFDIRRRVPDTSKMRDVIGWESKVKLDEGLREVIAWLKSQSSVSSKTLV